jgi:hypothetical protein
VRRGIWFVVGAGAGVYLTVRARRVAEVFTIDGLNDRMHALAHGARLFRDEVARGQAEAETDLRERFGLVPHGMPELVAPDPARTGSLTSTPVAGGPDPADAQTQESDD